MASFLSLACLSSFACYRQIPLPSSFFLLLFSRGAGTESFPDFLDEMTKSLLGSGTPVFCCVFHSEELV
jgi:hypothetical protein